MVVGLKGDIKIWYRNLDAKGKFIRSLWGGALALLFLYLVVWFAPLRPSFDNGLIKMWIPLVGTMLIVIDLAFTYTKWKREEKSKK